MAIITQTIKKTGFSGAMDTRAGTGHSLIQTDIHFGPVRLGSKCFYQRNHPLLPERTGQMTVITIFGIALWCQLIQYS